MKNTPDQFSAQIIHRALEDALSGSFCELKGRIDLITVIAETSLQLKKDFEMEGIAFEPDQQVSDPFERLSGEIISGITRALKARSLDRILYRLGIAESRASAVLENHEDPISGLGELILRRAVEKVLWRKMF